MAFRNPPIAGSYLVRPAIQSPNYSLGTSGWTINRDGTTEFNGGTFRGSLEAGSLTAQHFIVNNISTNDVVDVYNSANKLVFSIDSTGRLVAAASNSTSEVVLNGANLLFEDTAQTPQAQHLINGSVGPDSTFLNIFCARPQHYSGAGQGSFIQLTNGDTTASESIAAEQRGIQGVLLQTDNSANAGQLFHSETYTITTDASGNSNFAHHCQFTPTQGFLASVSVGGTDFYEYTWLSASPFTSTLASAHFNDKLGNNKVSTTFTAMGFFVG